ncbi:hypothetical protein E4U19_007067 [Claviceps sp. Clav32 group G5]|nr:hypothetical protein E4U19_007067 [Claviceps sp. Clav32 group G5]
MGVHTTMIKHMHATIDFYDIIGAKEKKPAIKNRDARRRVQRSFGRNTEYVDT